MSTTDLNNTGLKQNDASHLFNKLNKYSYENLFKLYKFDDDPSYFYNIINTIYIPEDIDNSIFDYFRVDGDQMTWTNISHILYGTQRLWWIICIANQIDNPIPLPKSGTILKILKPSYVQEVLTSIYNSNS